jgi:single-strand DNA-binding protein
MNGLNKVLLYGNLTADGDLRYTQAGQAVLNFRMATNETYLDKNRERQERVDYHACVCWGKRGEALAKILVKGSTIFVEGSLRTSSYDDKEGVKRYKTEVNVINVVLAGGKRLGGDSAEHERRNYGTSGGGSVKHTTTPEKEDDEFGGGDDNGDIPFITSEPNRFGL